MPLPWVETPDQAVVWGYALGLHHEVEDVLERTVTPPARQPRRVRHAYLPVWYVVGSPGSVRLAAGSMFSSSAIPDFGAMTAALSTIGNIAIVVGLEWWRGASAGGGSGGGGGGAGGGF